MKGSRSLTSDERSMLRNYFDERTDILAVRDKTLFFLSLYLGLRIAETLSIYARDVYKYDMVVDSIYILKRNTKGKIAGKICLLNERAKSLLEDYFWHYGMLDRMKLSPSLPLFWSSKGTNAITTRQGARIFTKAYVACRLTGLNGCTHCTRKTFAKEMYKKLNKNILNLSIAMGHKNISSTQSYIQGDDEDIRNALTTLTF